MVKTFLNLVKKTYIKNCKLWYIYTRKYYMVGKKKELLPSATVRMDVESMMLSEVR